MNGQINEAEQWSRHYDSVHWTVIYIFTAGVAALLSFAASSSYNWRIWFIWILGFAFTNLTVYFTASFREFRAAILFEIADEDVAKFLTDANGSRRLGMWLPFVLSYALLDACWLGVALTYLPETKLHLPLCVVVLIGVAVATAVVVFLRAMYKCGARPTFAQWKSNRSTRVSRTQESDSN
jgi:phosphoglycerol transferase MdoB-like AlkP superfamily enzyme